MKAKWIPLCYAGLMAIGVAAATTVGLSSVYRSRPSLPPVKGAPARAPGTAAPAADGSALPVPAREQLLRTLRTVAAFDAIEPLSVSSYPISPLSSADRAAEAPQPAPAADHRVSVVVMSSSDTGTAVIDGQVRKVGDMLPDGSRVQSIRPGRVVLVGPTGQLGRYAVTQSYAVAKPAKEQP